jgi:hypothetical protein
MIPAEQSRGAEFGSNALPPLKKEQEVPRKGHPLFQKGNLEMHTIRTAPEVTAPIEAPLVG